MCNQTATERRMREKNSKSEGKTKTEKQEREKYERRMLTAKMREQDGYRKRNATAAWQ